MPHAARPRRPVLSLLLALVSLFAALVVAELVLRLAGFRYELRATVIEGTAPNAAGVLEHYRIDPERLWVPNGYDATVTRAVATPPAIAFMGDSCTELGRYPELLAAMAAERLGGGGPLPYSNLGVAGWTTHQGLAQLELDVRRIRPRLVTVYYGWNDHWLSIGLADREVGEIARSILFRHQRLRLVQLANRTQVAVRAGGERPLRVPLSDFRDNLRRIVERARALGTTPVLLTAPTSHERGQEPRYLAGRWVADLDQLVPLHQSYVAAVREVAAAERAPLCDLAAAFAREPRWKLRTSYFHRDGIHLLEAGDRKLAAALDRCLAAHGLLRRTPLDDGS